MPGFSADASLSRTIGTYYGMTVAHSLNAEPVIPQGCDILKRFGCFWPISILCGLAGIGGADAFCNCVGQTDASCLECTSCAGSGLGLDPRDKSNLPASDALSATAACPSPCPAYPDLSKIERQLDRIQRQADRIDRCACGAPPTVAAPRPVDPILTVDPHRDFRLPFP
jgi:hypothetical protein